jgi:serine/threonine-protein phosphatase 2A activator
MASLGTSARELQVLDPNADHAFKLPVKRINDGEDVSFFLTSKAYSDIMTFIFQLNAAMMPRKIRDAESKSETTRAWTLQDTDISGIDIIGKLAALIAKLNSLIDEAPPDPGPRRFGNISFRRWHELVAKRISELMQSHLPSELLASHASSKVTAREELEVYLLGSFGSSQRLDYGSGHELSFLAFLGSLWKLGAFPASENGSQERGIVLGVLEPYVSMEALACIT